MIQQTVGQREVNGHSHDQLDKGKAYSLLPSVDLASGARQDSCRVNHAANTGKLSPSNGVFMTESRSGLSVTAPIGVQLRVLPDQRAGVCSWARRYTA